MQFQTKAWYYNSFKEFLFENMIVSKFWLSESSQKLKKELACVGYHMSSPSN
jgi:hypothetical protein